MVGSAFALNPQPEPPNRSVHVVHHSVLAIQPLVSSRSVQKADLVGLNPQPEPPSRKQGAPVNSRGVINPSRINTIRGLPPHSTGRPLAETQFQNTTQKQSQAVQMMHSVSKALHDSSLSVMRNLK